jgi:hypothetical protein
VASVGAHATTSERSKACPWNTALALKTRPLTTTRKDVDSHHLIGGLAVRH